MCQEPKKQSIKPVVMHIGQELPPCTKQLTMKRRKRGKKETPSSEEVWQEWLFTFEAWLLSKAPGCTVEARDPKGKILYEFGAAGPPVKLGLANSHYVSLEQVGCAKDNRQISEKLYIGGAGRRSRSKSAYPPPTRFQQEGEGWRRP